MGLILLLILILIWFFSIETFGANPYFTDKQIVRFGSKAHEIDPKTDLTNPITGENLINHHERLLESTVHEILRSKLIYLPASLPEAAEDTLIEFELFDGLVVLGSVTRLSFRSEDSIGWNGDVRIRLHPESHDEAALKEDLAEEVDGHFGLSCYMKACSANVVIYSRKEEYLIHPSGLPLKSNGYGVYSLSQVWLDPNKKSGSQLMQGQKLETRKLLSNNLRKTTVNDITDSTVVDTDLIYDILVFYTPESVTKFAAGNEELMRSMIYFANDQANMILSNSAVSLRYRVVGILSAGTNFKEPKGVKAPDILLQWLSTPNDGYLDIAQSLRDDYGADSVILITTAPRYAGNGYVNLDFSPDQAYATINGFNLGDGSIWAHEIGHNMGCYHDRTSDSAESQKYPTYPGFGNCWDDASKSDCTCYSSIMAIDCKTPNGCTSCAPKNYYANSLVIESGNPTGVSNANCGNWIDQNRLKPITYRKSIQPGGMIFSVTPNYALASACSLIKISGWSLGLTDDDIISVTLDGVATQIYHQTKHEVIVYTPIVPKPNGIPGFVVVTTRSKRVTTVPDAFTFWGTKYSDFQDFSNRTFPASIWSDNGTSTWLFVTEDDGNVLLLRDDSMYYDNTFYSQLLWQNKRRNGCVGYATSLKFQYWAYSRFKRCYDQFTVSYKTDGTETWTVIWNGQVGLKAKKMPWLNATITLPPKTTGLSIFVNTRNNFRDDCYLFTQVRIDNVETTMTIQCNSDSKCPDTRSPSITPTIAPNNKPTPRPPTARPTTAKSYFVPSVPSFKPTPSPGTKPTVTTMTPSQGTRSPSRVPTRGPSPKQTVKGF